MHFFPTYATPYINESECFLTIIIFYSFSYLKMDKEDHFLVALDFICDEFWRKKCFLTVLREDPY